VNNKIKFSMFRNRRRFNILTWLSKNAINTYPAFLEFLATKNVIPPPEDYYNKAKTKHDLDNTANVLKEELKTSKQEGASKEQINNKNVVEETVTPEPVVTEETKSKRRRRRKKEV
jgi:hypothetical protein